MKKYVIINNINAEIDFDAVDQDGIDNRLVDFLNRKFVVSYEDDMPECIKNISDRSEEYTKEEIIPILASPNWSIYYDFGPERLDEYDDHIKFYQEIL